MGLFDFFRDRRRARLRAAAFRESWLAILSKDVPLYARLTAEYQSELRARTQVLIAEKHFEGCGGLKITDEIRVTIAAHAALLELGREPHYYPGLDAILVYPSAYLFPEKRPVGGGIID